MGIKVAAVQAEPVWGDLQGSVNKVIELIQEAAKHGTQVLGFPQLFVPGYPLPIWTQAPLYSIEHNVNYMRNSMARDSPEMTRIQSAVKDAGMTVVLGYSEREGNTIYEAQAFIDRNGEILHNRRKIRPSHAKKTLFGEGQSESLKSVVDTDVGKVGGLICWEHCMPLLRYYEYSQGVQIHVASYIPTFEREGKQLFLRSAAGSLATAQFMAMEGATFVLVPTSVVSAENREKAGVPAEAKLPGGGHSQIYWPHGMPLAEPIGPHEEGILYAEIDLAEIELVKHFMDTVGHHARPDFLSLRVNAAPIQHVHHI